MGLLDTFFDPTERQRRKLETLRAKRADLAREHATAVAAGDDAAESKAWAALAKVDSEIRAAEAAAAIADQVAARAQADAEAEDMRLKIETAEQATQAYEAKAAAMERAALSVAPFWRELVEAEKAMHAARVAAGVGAYVGVGGFTAGHVWDLSLMHLGREVHRPLPQLNSWSRPLETVAELLARKGAAARPWQTEEPESV